MYTTIWGLILELLVSIKNAMIEHFNDRYATFSVAAVAAATMTVAAAGVYRERSFQY